MTRRIRLSGLVLVLLILFLSRFSVYAAVVRIKITPDELVQRPVSPLVTGNFIESGLAHQVDGMWSELLFNRSFEDIPLYKRYGWDWLNRGPDDDLSREVWWHSGYEENAWYLTPGNPNADLQFPRYSSFHHGFQAARLVNRSPDAPAFLVQDGIHLRKGVTYRFRGSFRRGGMPVPEAPDFEIKVGIYRDGDVSRPLVEKAIPGVGNIWLESAEELADPDFEGRASFAVVVPPGKDVVMDGLSLMPSDSFHGWRREVVEAVRRVHPPIIRFPGGCFASFSNWRDGIGPRSERRPRPSEFWGGLENNDVGTAEFITLCREIGAEPFLCVNLLTGSAAEAADWVAYCNAPETQPLGALRKQHGFATPFGVKYWELDNETYRRYGALEYARRCVDFARAMKAMDSSIRLVMVGYDRYQPLIPQMLEIAGGEIDLVTDRETNEAGLRETLGFLEDYNARTGRSVRLCNTEWLAPSEDVPVLDDPARRPPTEREKTLQNRQIRWKYAMNAARQVLVFQRLGGDFEFANFNNMANTWGQNVIECAKEAVIVSAAGRMFELLSRSTAAWPLKLEGPRNSELVVQAAWDLERRSLVVDVLNYKEESAEMSFDMSALGFKAWEADVAILHSSSLAARNSIVDPDAIRREDSCVPLRSRTEFRLAVPPYSVSHAVLR